jgi:hypothetical protein
MYAQHIFSTAVAGIFAHDTTPEFWNMYAQHEYSYLAVGRSGAMLRDTQPLNILLKQFAGIEDTLEKIALPTVFKAMQSMNISRQQPSAILLGSKNDIDVIPHPANIRT